MLVLFNFDGCAILASVMSKANRKRETDRPQLRLLAWVLALVVAAISWLFVDGREGLFLDISAALIFAVGTVWPQAFRWLYRGLWSFAFLLRGRKQGV